MEGDVVVEGDQPAHTGAIRVLAVESDEPAVCGSTTKIDRLSNMLTHRVRVPKGTHVHARAQAPHLTGPMTVA